MDDPETVVHLLAGVARFELERFEGGWRWRLMDDVGMLALGERRRWRWLAGLSAWRFRRNVVRASVK